MTQLYLAGYTGASKLLQSKGGSLLFRMKTSLFEALIKKAKDKASEVFEIKEFTAVNDCFKNKSNAVLGFFYQRLLIIISGHRPLNANGSKALHHFDSIS